MTLQNFQIIHSNCGYWKIKPKFLFEIQAVGEIWTPFCALRRCSLWALMDGKRLWASQKKVRKTGRQDGFVYRHLGNWLWEWVGDNQVKLSLSKTDHLKDAGPEAQGKAAWRKTPSFYLPSWEDGRGTQTCPGKRSKGVQVGWQELTTPSQGAGA